MKIYGQISTIVALLDAYGMRKKADGKELSKRWADEERERKVLSTGNRFLYSTEKAIVGVTKSALKSVPFKPDLSEEEYTDMMQTWMPITVCDFRGIHPKNIEGAAAAVFDILNDFPEVAGWAQSYASPKGVSAHYGDTSKEEIFELYKNNPVKREQIRIRADEVFDERKEWFTENASDKTAKAFALYCGVSSNSRVKTWLKKNGEDAECSQEFIDLVRKANSDKEIKKGIKDFAEQRGWYEGKRLRTPRMPKNAMAAVWYEEGQIIMNDYGSKDYRTPCIKSKASGFYVQFREEDAGGKSVMTHEFGHVLDQMLDVSKDYEIKKIWEFNKGSKLLNGLSEYGNTNIHEMIAEAFCEYRLSDSPRPIAKSVGDRMMELYKKQYGG